ncbi:MAG TPA: GNAT family N-acetyltransferase [Pseudonocardiaceae bacterium]
MGDYDFRVLESHEYRNAGDVFLGALHIAPATDEHWSRVQQSYETGRTLGAFAGDVLVGVATTFPSGLAVPGGAVLPMAMVTWVGVRADHTRRGVLTGLMRAQLSGLAEPFASLRASEGVIYGRFGYGVATRGRTVRVTRASAISQPDAPTGGHVRLIDLDQAERLLPEIYRRIGPARPGWADRDGYWWGSLRSFVEREQRPVVFAVHSGPDGDDGFVIYQVSREPGRPPAVLEVDDLMAGSVQAWAGLWRFLLDVDLVHEVEANLRPLDEPLELLFTDRRAVASTSIADETWLRIADVPVALAARSFGETAGNAGPVVIEVRDPLLPANSGRYRIGDGPARPVGEPAELVMDVGALGTIYLGDVAPSALAAAGRLQPVKDDAVAVADRLFAVITSPWCGSYF